MNKIIIDDITIEHIVKILSDRTIKEKHEIEFDKKKKTIFISIPNGNLSKFDEYKKELYRLVSYNLNLIDYSIVITSFL